MRLAGVGLALLLGACGAVEGDAQAARKQWTEKAFAGPAGEPSKRFPNPARPVADIVTDTWSDDDSREEVGEARIVMAFSGVRAGSVVADIGAGSGYYTVRLARAVAPGGRVYAQDIVPNYVDRLRARVAAERVAGVTVSLGEAHDPRLPPGVIDVALLVHMYHEIEQPYALMWNLWASLKPTGVVAVVDTGRSTARHGTPPKLLECELRAVGFVPAGRRQLDTDSYVALFRRAAARPEPESIKVCRA